MKMDLEKIKPLDRLRVMDLVDSAGIDISDWGNFKGGEEKAASNPKYCYEWSYVNHEKKVIVINLWYSEMEVKDGAIIRNINMKNIAERNTNSPRKKRALNMDFAFQKAVREALPIRVIVCDGQRTIDIGGVRENAKVERRLLDPENWYVTEYNPKTGDCFLKRGALRSRYVDQFEEFDFDSSLPHKKEKTTKFFERSAVVRRVVLERAEGHCEWCRDKGFITASGAIYLESHHVVPLSEEGLDSKINVIGLCPNHHREAHYGKDAVKMREKLLEKVKKLNGE